MSLLWPVFPDIDVVGVAGVAVVSGAAAVDGGNDVAIKRTGHDGPTPRLGVVACHLGAETRLNNAFATLIFYCITAPFTSTVLKTIVRRIVVAGFAVVFYCITAPFTSAVLSTIVRCIVVAGFAVVFYCITAPFTSAVLNTCCIACISSYTSIAVVCISYTAPFTSTVLKTIVRRIVVAGFAVVFYCITAPYTSTVLNTC